MCLCPVHSPSAAEDDQYFSKVSFRLQTCLFPMSTSRTPVGLPLLLLLLQNAYACTCTCTRTDSLVRARKRARRNADINKDGISTSSHRTKMKLQPLPEVFDVCVYVCARACVSWRASRFSACAPAHTLISRAQLFWFLSPFPYYRNTLSKEKNTIKNKHLSNTKPV